jgi:hypothetical protein
MALYAFDGTWNKDLAGEESLRMLSVSATPATRSGDIGPALERGWARSVCWRGESGNGR